METDKLKPLIQFFLGICNFSHKNDLFNDVQKCGILFGKHNMNICTFAHENAAEGMGEWVKGATLAGKSTNS